MKDAYSFHIDQPSLQEGYRAMLRCLYADFHANWAQFSRSSRRWGGHRRDVSQEFHVLASSGEDAIVFSDTDDYARTSRRPSQCARRAAPHAEGKADEVVTPGAKDHRGPFAFS